MKLDQTNTGSKARTIINNYGPWEKKFIWWDIINNKHILFKYVWRRACGCAAPQWHWDYALSDFDILTKSSDNYQSTKIYTYYF